MKDIQQGYMAFFHEGSEGVGAVTDVTADEIVVYVENFGPFTVPMSAVKRKKSGPAMSAAMKPSPAAIARRRVLITVNPPAKWRSRRAPRAT